MVRITNYYCKGNMIQNSINFKRKSKIYYLLAKFISYDSFILNSLANFDISKAVTSYDIYYF